MKQTRAKMLLSVLIPVYDERPNLGPLHKGLKTVLDGLGHDHEIIFVNDGSGDGSGESLDKLAAEDAAVQVIHFRRNYGQTAALMAAIFSFATSMNSCGMPWAIRVSGWFSRIRVR